MKLKALKTYELNGIVLTPGSEFFASEHIAKQLIAMKQAESLEIEDHPSQIASGLDLSIYVLKTDFDALKDEFDAFKNNPDALKGRLAELESLVGTQQQSDENTLDYSKLSVDEIKALLIEKSVDFKQSAKKDELLALIPKE